MRSVIGPGQLLISLRLFILDTGKTSIPEFVKKISSASYKSFSVIRPSINGILLSLVALVSYAIIGKPLSLKVSNQSYHSFISIFILIYGFFSIIS